MKAEKSNREKQIIRISKQVFEIRKALGYATPYQIEEGWEGELSTVKSMINRTNQKSSGHSTGGFTYTIMKSGSVKVSPEFNWIVKPKDI